AVGRAARSGRQRPRDRLASTRGFPSPLARSSGGNRPGSPGIRGGGRRRLPVARVRGFVPVAPPVGACRLPYPPLSLDLRRLAAPPCRGGPGAPRGSTGCCEPLSRLNARRVHIATFSCEDSAVERR